MGAVLVLDPACEAVTARLKSDVALLDRVGLRIYPDANGQVPERRTHPYVSVEGDGELPFDTLGPDTGRKWGGFAHVWVRVASQFRGDLEVRQLTSLVKQRLHGQTVMLATFGAGIVTFERMTRLEDTVAGVQTREWISEYEVFAHQ